MLKISLMVKEILFRHIPLLSEKEKLFRLSRECLRHQRRLTAGIASLLVLAVTRLYLTWLVKEWTEGPLVTGDASSVYGIVLAAVLTTGVMVAAIFTSRYLIVDVNQRVIQGIRDRVQQKLMEMGVAGVRQFKSGDLFSRIFSDVGNLSLLVRDIFERVIGESLVAIGAIGLMLYLDWRLAFLICAVVPPAAFVLNSLTSIIRRWAAKAQRKLGGLSAIFSEQVHGITTIKGFQSEMFERDRFSHLNKTYRRQFMHSELWNAVLTSTIWLVTGLGLLGMLWYGSRQVLAGEITPGALITFCLCAGQMIEPVRRLSDVNAGLQRSLAAADRVFEIIDSGLFEPDGNLAVHHPITGHLSLDHLCFHYPHGEEVLKDLTLSVTALETVALVAPSGGGKSTLARLSIRFWDPLGGRIFLDGVDIRSLRLADLRRAVCVVEQEPFVFSGSLMENISYGSWHAPSAAIDSAIKLAGLEDLACDLPGGVNGILDEGGHNLSGGQKQRIALARAIVRDPAVLILDEATSAIDSDTEQQIFEKLKEWLARRTVIVMAHRLSTISRFSRIIVLDEGLVVGDGGLSELVKTCPPFIRLFSEQLGPPKIQV